MAAHRGTSFAQGPGRAQGAGVRKEERGRGGSEEIGDIRVSQLVTATASPLGHRLIAPALSDVRRSKLNEEPKRTFILLCSFCKKFLEIPPILDSILPFLLNINGARTPRYTRNIHDFRPGSPLA